MHWRLNVSDALSARTYARRTIGDNEGNVKLAISYYENALDVRTKGQFPDLWLNTTFNLADMYGRHGLLRKSLDLLEDALPVAIRLGNTNMIGQIHKSIGEKYVFIDQSINSENLEKTISHLSRALEIFDLDSSPIDWQKTLASIVFLYSLAADKLDKKYFEYCISFGEKLFRSSNLLEHETEVAVSCTLGKAYENRLEGNQNTNNEAALSYYKKALVKLKPEANEKFREFYFEAKYNSANILTQSHKGDHLNNLLESNSHLHNLMNYLTKKDDREKWVKVQNLLGINYAELKNDEHPQNIESAIEHFNNALSALSKESSYWTTVNINLANCYAHRTAGNSISNLDKAKEIYFSVLEVIQIDSEEFYNELGLVFHNLGSLLKNYPIGDKSENIEQGIYYFEKASEYRSPQNNLSHWAQTRIALAGAYLNRLNGRQSDNVHQLRAIAEDVLEKISPEINTEEYLKIKGYLGLSYISTNPDLANPEIALKHFTEAISFASVEEYPEQWGVLNSNIWNVYNTRSEGTKENNIELAIEHLQSSLRVFTKKAYPDNWARTQAALGLAYKDRILGVRENNINIAKKHFQNASKLCNKDSDPQMYRQIMGELAKLYFEEYDWKNAMTSYEAAISVGNAIFDSSYSRMGLEAEVGESADFFVNACYACLQEKKYEEAFIALEKGKMRLSHLNLYKSDIVNEMSSNERETIEKLQKEITDLEYKIQYARHQDTHIDYLSLSQDLRNKRRILEAAFPNIPSLDATDKSSTNDFIQDVLNSIPENSAIIALVITYQGSAAFIIPSNTNKISEDNVCYFDFRSIDLSKMIKNIQGNGDVSPDQSGGASKQLKQKIYPAGRIIWEQIIKSINKKIATLDVAVNNLYIIAQGGLQLIPLHAAYREDRGEKIFLIDDFSVSYLPSFQSLMILRSKNKGLNTIDAKEFFIAGVGEYSDFQRLKYSVDEAKLLADVLQTESITDNKVTQLTVISGLKSTDVFHFAGHGSYNWDGDPLESALYFLNSDKLTLRDILNKVELKGTKLVTLSACETGVIDASKIPDESIGMPLGFLQAGASSVVSSLWVVNDISSLLFMYKFYQGISKGNYSIRNSFADAQLWLKNSTVREIVDVLKEIAQILPESSEILDLVFELKLNDTIEGSPFSDPYYWASFTYTGI